MNKKAAAQPRAQRELDTPEKYSEFERSVLDAAHKQGQLLLEDARRQGQALYDQLTAGQRDDPLVAYRAKAATRRRHSAAAARQENRKKLLVYRGQLVNGLFAEVQEALDAYTRTPAYPERIARILAQYAGQLSDGCAVHIRPGDEAALSPVVRTALPGARIIPDSSIRLGGVKLETQRILYDETLDFAAAAERAAFLSRCKLRVE